MKVLTLREEVIRLASRIGIDEEGLPPDLSNERDCLDLALIALTNFNQALEFVAKDLSQIAKAILLKEIYLNCLEIARIVINQPDFCVYHKRAIASYSDALSCKYKFIIKLSFPDLDTDFLFSDYSWAYPS